MNFNKLTLTSAQQKFILQNRLEGIIMLCSLILLNNNIDITAEAIRRLSGYSTPSIRRGLKIMVKNGYFKMETLRNNGRYGGVRYIMTNNLLDGGVYA